MSDKEKQVSEVTQKLPSQKRAYHEGLLETEVSHPIRILKEYPKNYQGLYYPQNRKNVLGVQENQPTKEDLYNPEFEQFAEVFGDSYIMVKTPAEVQDFKARKDREEKRLSAQLNSSGESSLPSAEFVHAVFVEGRCFEVIVETPSGAEISVNRHEFNVPTMLITEFDKK